MRRGDDYDVTTAVIVVAIFVACMVLLVHSVKPHRDAPATDQIEAAHD